MIKLEGHSFNRIIINGVNYIPIGIGTQTIMDTGPIPLVNDPYYYLTEMCSVPPDVEKLVFMYDTPYEDVFDILGVDPDYETYIEAGTPQWMSNVKSHPVYIPDGDRKVGVSFYNAENKAQYVVTNFPYLLTERSNYSTYPGLTNIEGRPINAFIMEEQPKNFSYSAYYFLECNNMHNAFSESNVEGTAVSFDSCLDMSYSFINSHITNTRIGTSVENVDSAFRGCRTLYNGSVGTNVVYMNNAFRSSSVDFADLKNAQYCDYAYKYSMLKNCYISPVYRESGVECFSGTKFLSGVDQPLFNDGSNAFYASSVSHVNAVDYDGDLNNWSNMYRECRNLISSNMYGTINIDNASNMFAESGVSYIVGNNTAMENTSFMYRNCKNLLRAYCPPQGKYLTSDWSNMYNGCRSLAETTSLDAPGATNASNMFAGCYRLENAYSPEGVQDAFWLNIGSTSSNFSNLMRGTNIANVVINSSASLLSVSQFDNFVTRPMETGKFINVAIMNDYELYRSFALTNTWYGDEYPGVDPSTETIGKIPSRPSIPGSPALNIDGNRYVLNGNYAQKIYTERNIILRFYEGSWEEVE